MNRYFRAIVFCSLSLAAACGKGSDSGGGGTPFTPPPFDPLPAVSSTVPVNQATGVLTTEAVSARFSESMDAFYVMFTPSLTLSSAGGPVDGDVTVSPDGRDAIFTPSAPLEYDTTYTATILAGALGATGQALAVDYQWTFTTIPAPLPPPWAWSEPVGLDANPGVPVNYSSPDIAIDDSQNACAVWIRVELGVRRVYAARSVQGGAWEPAEVMAGSDGSYSPQVAIFDTGEILVVWGTLTEVWESRATLTGAWSDPELVDSRDDWSMPQELFVDTAGNAMLFYRGDTGSGVYYNEFAVRFDADDGWESRVELPCFSVQNPTFAGDATGTAVAIWTDRNSGGAANPDDWRIFARRYSPASGWSDTVVVDPNTANLVTIEPYVALDGNGNAVAVWMRRIPGWGQGSNEIYMSLMDSSGSWSEPELVPIGQLVSQDAWAALNPDDGTVVVTFVGTLSWIRASIRDVTGTWTDPVIVDANVPDVGPTGIPFFAGDGRIRIIGEKGNVLWVCDYTAQDGWSAPATLYTSGYDSIIHFDVSLNTQGQAAAIWMEYDEDDNANSYVGSSRFLGVGE